MVEEMIASAYICPFGRGSQGVSSGAWPGAGGRRRRRRGETAKRYSDKVIGKSETDGSRGRKREREAEEDKRMTGGSGLVVCRGKEEEEEEAGRKETNGDRGGLKLTDASSTGKITAA